MTEHADRLSPALERLLIRFGEMVRRVGRRHRLADSDVDEVVQEVRVRLWRALASGEKIEAAPASYVYRTAVSAALDLIRRRRTKREETLELNPEAEAIAQAQPGIDQALEQEDLAAAVTRAIDGLVASRRPVVRMYLAGYQLEEIAELMGWTEPKTRNLVYRGLADLRAALTARGIGPEGLP